MQIITLPLQYANDPSGSYVILWRTHHIYLWKNKNEHEYRFTFWPSGFIRLRNPDRSIFRHKDQFNKDLQCSISPILEEHGKALVNRNKKCSDFGKKNYSGNGNSLCSNFGNNSAVTVVLN